jgi:hypothetical protein
MCIRQVIAVSGNFADNSLLWKVYYPKHPELQYLVSTAVWRSANENAPHWTELTRESEDGETSKQESFHLKCFIYCGGFFYETWLKE